MRRTPRIALVIADGSISQRPRNEPPPHSPAAENSQQPSAVSAAAPELQRRDARYRLCASDTISLAFPLTPEFDQTVDIQPDGLAALAAVGDIRSEGLTTEETVRAVQAAYSKFLRDPIVIVELKNFNKPYFIVGGQVHQPGKYDLRGNTTASQAIAIAGGFNDSAKHSQVLLFRRLNNDWFEVKNLNLKRILQGHEPVKIRRFTRATCCSSRRVRFPKSSGLFRTTASGPITSCTARVGNRLDGRLRNTSIFGSRGLNPDRT
jgi:protein involved in polysaccharide export with SLBB domain